jgi:hypothetical protein
LRLNCAKFGAVTENRADLLWPHQGRTEDARQVLASIYGWFTEGFETANLGAAKALIGDLR